MFKKVWSILLCLVLLTGTLLPVSALNVTPDYGNAHVSIEAEDLGGGEAVLAVYLNNCVGLTAFEVFIDIEGSSLRYFYWADGLDADEVDESKSNVFTAECNELPDGIVKCGGYFKECLWTAEDFAANAKKNKDCAVNTEKFHCMDIYMEYDDEIDLSVISAIADLEFKGCESFANTYLGKGFIYGTAVPVTVRKAQVCKHDGATEIRNAKEPTYTATGYTGDSYCLLCNEKIATGSVIPVLSNIYTPNPDADVEVEFEYDETTGEVKADLYLIDAVGVSSFELAIDCFTDGAKLQYVDFAVGEDAKQVGNSYSNSFACESAPEDDGKHILFGAYFKNCLWTSEHFFADSDYGKICDVNADRFHFATYYFEISPELANCIAFGCGISGYLKFKGDDSDDIEYAAMDDVVISKRVNLSVGGCCHLDTEIRNAKDPTYTEEGYTGDTYCVDCNKKLSTGSVIPVLEKTDSYMSLEVQDLGEGEVAIDVYLNNCIGLTSLELFIDIEGSGLTYAYDEIGADADEVSKCKNNAYNSECNELEANTLFKYGSYFKDCLWTAEHFAADAKKGQQCTVNTEKFHCATIYMEYDGEIDLSALSATADVEFGGGDLDAELYPDIGFIYDTFVPVTIIEAPVCNHDGPTEIRNAKDPTYTATGYTGDTYCLLCNEKIATGSVIPVLEKTDSYMSLEVQDLGEGEVAIDVYLNNCIGLTSLELFIDIEGSGLTYAYDEIGADADEVSKCKNNAYNSECNELEANTLFKYGSYFKDCLWTAEHFAADAKKGQQCTVNTEKFHCATIYMEYDGEIDLSALSATADVEFGGGDLDAELYPDIGFIYDTFVPVIILKTQDCKHDGPTEIRNAKEPTRQEDGYTGDTYCLLCNEKIASGPMIPKIVDYYIVPVSDGAIDDGYLAVDVYLDNCVGLTSFDFDFTYPSEYFSFEYIERGADAKKIFTTSHPNAINMDYNEIEPGSVQIGAYFKEGLLSKQHFIDTSFMEPCVVNDTYFHFATIYFMCRKTDVQFSMEAITCFDFNGFTYEGVSYPAYGKYTSDPTPFSVQTYCAHTQSEIRNQLDPTCVNDGYTGDKCCTFCNATLAAGTTVVALGHAFDDGVIAVEPTYVAEGEKLFTCTRCPEQKTEPIEKLVAVFEDSENCKEDEDGTIVSVGERTVEQLLEQASPGAYITDKNGEQLDAEAKYGTGCVLVQPDGNTVTLVVAGDVSGDGCVEAEDARTALRAAVSLQNLTEEYFKAADINGDGVISAEDARLALRAAVGLEDLSKWL